MTNNTEQEVEVAEEDEQRQHIQNLGTALQMELSILAQREDEVSQTRIDLVKEYHQQAERLLEKDLSDEGREQLELFIEVSDNSLDRVEDFPVVEDREVSEE